MKPWTFPCRVKPNAFAHLPNSRIAGMVLLVLVVLFFLPACRDTEVALRVYGVNHEESINQLTVGIRRVFYRPEFDASLPNAPNRAPDLVLVEGYFCNYASKPVRVYNLANNSEGRQQFATFRWGHEDNDAADGLFVGGGGSRTEQSVSRRLRQTSYDQDASGALYFEIPANEERQFTIRGDHRRLDSSDSEGVLELERVELADEGAPWMYRIAIPLTQSNTVKVIPRQSDKHYPVFGRGDPESQCSPRLGS